MKQLWKFTSWNIVYFLKLCYCVIHLYLSLVLTSSWKSGTPLYILLYSYVLLKLWSLFYPLKLIKIFFLTGAKECLGLELTWLYTLLANDRKYHRFEIYFKHYVDDTCWIWLKGNFISFWNDIFLKWNLKFNFNLKALWHMLIHFQANSI